MRGDRPRPSSPPAPDHQFTPHARGSTLLSCSMTFSNSVYPACAGIDLPKRNANTARTCLPRMRGDRPGSGQGAGHTGQFTPHARGSTITFRGPTSAELVYPACAGIDRSKKRDSTTTRSLPRMRGDRPRLRRRCCTTCLFTPHARGSTYMVDWSCTTLTVYPACAGIDRTCSAPLGTMFCLPRMRGDRPGKVEDLRQGVLFTPHARGSTFH